MKEEIELKELLKFKNQESLLYASNSKKKKRLYITLYGNYEVHQEGVKVFETNKANKVVDFYNNI